MRLKLSELPELPAERHPFFLLPERELALPKGGTIRYRETGQGPAVLLLHGLWTTAFTFRNLIAPLGDRLRLVLPELIDERGRNPLAVEDYRPVRLADLALSICDQLGLERLVLVGHAECGLAGLELAIGHPGRLLGLVVLGTPTRLPAATRLSGWWRGRGQARGWARAGFAQPFQAALAMLDYADPTVLSRQEVRVLARGWSNLPGASARARILTASLRGGYRRPTLERLEARMTARGELGVPLKLAYGQLDRKAPPEHGQRLNRLIPGSELLVAERSSGAVQVERPLWTAQILASAAGLSDS